MKFLECLFKKPSKPAERKKSPPLCGAESAIKPLKRRIQKIEYGIEEIEGRLDQVLEALSGLKSDKVQGDRASQNALYEPSKEQIKALLNLTDNIFYALRGINGPAGKALSILQQQAQGLLACFDIQPLSPEKVPFDDQFHEVREVVSEEEIPDLQVVRTLRPGYVMRGRLLRPAWVVVNRQDSFVNIKGGESL